jgi:predicted ATPase
MKIKKLSLYDFKGFKKLEELEIKPLTIIVGKNSCGKSSIIHSLLLLKQTLDSSYINNKLEFEGDYLQYSNIKEISFGQPPINKAKIEYKIEFNNNEEEKKTINFSFKHKKNNSIYDVILDKFVVEENGEKLDFVNLKKTQVSKSLSKSHFNFMDKGRILNCSPTFNHFIPDGMNIEFKNKEAKKRNNRLPLFVIFDTKFDFIYSIPDIFNKMKYLSPVRALPKRAYIHFSQLETQLLSDGSNSAHILWLNQNKSIKFKNNDNIKLIDAVNQCFTIMGLKQQITPSRIGDIIYKLNVKESYTNSQVSIADVGFGYSQVLPIILTGLLSEKQSMILIEQPEIHLHPSSSANLADLFLSFLENTDRQFLIETHSQEFINRLRLRVIENPILKELINIVFVEENLEQNENIGSKIRQFQIDENGMFPEYPEGFLDESEKLANAILDARLKKFDNE